MTAPTIRGNLEEMLDRAHAEKLKNEDEEKKLKELISLKNAIIEELDDKYHFDRICLSIEKFNDILPSLINYIDDPNPELKKPLLKKIDEFIKCYGDG